MIRNPVPWPNGCKVACAITFDIDTDSILHLEHRNNAPMMISTISWLKYDEISVPRLVELYRCMASVRVCSLGSLSSYWKDDRINAESQRSLVCDNGRDSQSRPGLH